MVMDDRTTSSLKDWADLQAFLRRIVRSDMTTHRSHGGMQVAQDVHGRVQWLWMTARHHRPRIGRTCRPLSTSVRTGKETHGSMEVAGRARCAWSSAWLWTTARHHCSRIERACRSLHEPFGAEKLTAFMGKTGRARCARSSDRSCDDLTISLLRDRADLPDVSDFMCSRRIAFSS